MKMICKQLEKTAEKKKGGAVRKKKDEDEAYTGGAKPKAEKDPNAPKKPMTSYFIYMNE